MMRLGTILPEARVPHGLFTRAFVRAYAAEVSLDPDLIAEQYCDGSFRYPVDPPCHRRGLNLLRM